MSEERAGTQRALQNPFIADKLRGAVDGRDFKQYVLGMICYRFLSEEFAAYIEKDERSAFSD